MERGNRAWTWWLVAGVVGLTLVAARLARRDEESEDEALSQSSFEALAPTARGTAARESVATADDAEARGSLVEAQVPVPLVPAAPATDTRVRGVVIDVHGHVVPDVSLIDPSGSARGRSDTQGEFACAAGAGRLVPLPPWTLVRSVQGERRTLVVAPTVTLRGRIETRDGDAVPCAFVQSFVPAASLAPPLAGSDVAFFAGNHARTDSDGALFLQGVPVVDGALLDVTCAGFQPRALPVPRVSLDDLAIVLEPSSAPEAVDPNSRIVLGTVHFSDGRPARDASVSLWPAVGTSNENGEFRLVVPSTVDDHAALFAGLRGHQPALIRDFGQRTKSAELAPAELVLGGAPLHLSGWIVDDEGRPASGWKVALHDGTHLDLDEHLYGFAEGAGESEATTSAGAFELRGLMDRAYRLNVWSPTELRSFVTAPLRAGRDDARIRVTKSARFARLSGVVVGADERGIGGVEVRAALVMMRGTLGSHTIERGAPVRTRDDGAFEIQDVPAVDALLELSGSTIEPTQRAITPDDETHPLVIRVTRSCQFRVEGVPIGAGAAALEIQDAHGRVLTVRRFEDGHSRSAVRQALANGGSRMLAVSEDAAMVVFFDGDGREIAIHPIRLVPGGYATVTW